MLCKHCLKYFLFKYTEKVKVRSIMLTLTYNIKYRVAHKQFQMQKIMCNTCGVFCHFCTYYTDVKIVSLTHVCQNSFSFNLETNCSVTNFLSSLMFLHNQSQAIALFKLPNSFQILAICNMMYIYIYIYYVYLILTYYHLYC